MGALAFMVSFDAEMSANNRHNRQDGQCAEERIGNSSASTGSIITIPERHPLPVAKSHHGGQ